MEYKKLMQLNDGSRHKYSHSFLHHTYQTFIQLSMFSSYETVKKHIAHIEQGDVGTDKL